MKIALLTHYLPTKDDDYQKLADLTIPNRDDYCKKHGYQHIVQCGAYKDVSLYYAVQRIHLIWDIFNKQDSPDLIWVLNVQAVITNSRHKITNFIDDEHDFFIHADINGLNAGSFIIRKSEWSKKWLDFIIEKSADNSHCWHEQKIMIDNHSKPEWAYKIKILDHPGINSYQYFRYGRGTDTPGDWRPDHLCLSLPGLTLKERLEIVGSDEIQSIIKPMESKNNQPKFFNIIMVSAFHEQAGNTLLRFLDSHPSLYCYPFESQISTPQSTSIIDESFVPNRYRYPEFLSEITPKEAYANFWDQELKTYLRTPHLSKFKDCGIIMDEKARVDIFQQWCEKLANVSEDWGGSNTNTRVHYLEAFFRSTFETWGNYNHSGQETHYVGYSPPILFNADKFFSDFSNGQMVHIIRNVWSGYADTIKRPFPFSLTKYCQIWNMTQLTALTYAEKYKDRFHIVFFEDLIEDKKKVMDSLMGKLKLPISDRVYYPSFNGRDISGSIFPFGTIRHATPEANMATAKELSPEQTDQITAECGVMLKILGYIK